MLRRIAVLIACLVVSLSWAANAQPPIPEEVLESARLRVERKYNVGIVIGLVDAGGVTYSAVGLTTPGGEPLDESSVFEIGSITKVFTTTALARMAERGELSLEDLVADHLPDGVTMPQYGDEPIRLVDLATHQSGLPRQPTNMPMRSNPVLFLWLRGHPPRLSTTRGDWPRWRLRSGKAILDADKFQ